MQSLSQARLWVFLEKNRVRVRKVLWFLCGSPERGLAWTRAGPGLDQGWGRGVGRGGGRRGTQDSGQGMGCSVAEPRRDAEASEGPSGGMGGRGTSRRRRPGGHCGLAFYKWKQLRAGKGVSRASLLDKEENSAIPPSCLPGPNARACVLSRFSHV